MKESAKGRFFENYIAPESLTSIFGQKQFFVLCIDKLSFVDNFSVEVLIFPMLKLLPYWPLNLLLQILSVSILESGGNNKGSEGRLTQARTEHFMLTCLLLNLSFLQIFVN